MWQKVATEMGIPWRSAESMHWQLGEQEMSARANAPVFQLHPSATSNSSPSQIAAIPAPIPAPTSHGFTPANATQLMPSSQPVSAQHHQAPPPPSQQGPAHPFHQRTDSGSSQGRRRNDSFSRRRANTLSRSSVPPQLCHPLPQIQAASAEDLVSGARTAPAPIMQSSIKREGECPSYIEQYQKRRWEDDVTGPSQADLDARSQGGRSPDKLSQRSATGSVKSFKRESGEFERPATTALPSPPVPVAP
jgi:hypothetical protein